MFRPYTLRQGTLNWFMLKRGIIRFVTSEFHVQQFDQEKSTDNETYQIFIYKPLTVKHVIREYCNLVQIIGCI